MRLIKTTLLLLLISASHLVLAAAPTPSHKPDALDLTEPKIITITKKHNIRVVYDAKDDVWDAGIGKALYYVRGLVQSYDALGVPQKERKISIVLHGPTAYWVLNEETYRQFKNDEFAFNPNEQVVRELVQHGVSVEVCNVTLRGKGWSGQDILPGVTVVRDAYTRIIDLQQQGYAYIRF
jgi:intracellular sulfur oxidation DsrE/DsrF family protein